MAVDGDEDEELRRILDLMGFHSSLESANISNNDMQLIKVCWKDGGITPTYFIFHL